jgi:hypothetical protein
LINRQNIGPWRITKNIPGLQTLLETLGVLSDSGAKAPATLWRPELSLVLQVNADGTLTTVVNNVGPTPAAGLGFLVGINIGNPGGGSEWSFTAATLATQSGLSIGRARLRGISANFTTSAVVANRFVSLVVRGANDTIAPSPSIITQYLTRTAMVASNGGQSVLFTPGAIQDAPEQAGGFPNIIVPILDDIWLPSRVGWSVGTRTAGLQAGDAWTTINGLWEVYST